MSLVKDIINVIDEKSGHEIVVLDMRLVSPFMDYMVVTHVSNERLLHAMANHVTDLLDKKNINYPPIEGGPDSRWLLVDGQEVIVHIFLEDERRFYNLEKLWSDCIIEIDKLP